MQNPIIKNIIAKISHKYPGIDTILLFGSALDPDWTEKSDIDLYFIDKELSDGRIDLIIDNIKIEIQTNSFNDLENYIKEESGKLLNRNVSTMIATSKIVKCKSKKQVEKLIVLAKETLRSKIEFTDEDIKMWKYSIYDYLEKTAKDAKRNDIVAFYFDAHFVIQNAVELILATNNYYFPQPKKLTSIFKTIAPEFLQIIKEYELATSLDKKLQALQKLQNTTLNIIK